MQNINSLTCGATFGQFLNGGTFWRVFMIVTEVNNKARKCFTALVEVPRVNDIQTVETGHFYRLQRFLFLHR